MDLQKKERSRPRAVSTHAADFEALIEEAGDLIYALDLEGRFAFYNHACERVLGYPQGDLVDTPFVGILTPESAKGRFATLRPGALWQRELTRRVL